MWDIFSSNIFGNAPSDTSRNLQSNLGTQALQQATNASQVPNFFDTDKLNSISRGFNMSLQNAQTNSQQKLADTESSYLTMPIMQQYNKTLYDIKNRYRTNGFSAGSTYEALSNSLANRELNDSLLKANQQAYLNSFNTSNAYSANQMNNANIYANMGTNAQQIPLDMLTSLLGNYTNMIGTNQTQIKDNSQQALALLDMLMR